MLPDQELIDRAKRGDPRAFSDLWQRHHRRVLGFCRRYVGQAGHDSAADEDDLASETFVRALLRPRLAPLLAPAASGRAPVSTRSRLRQVETALAEIVGDWRIVTVSLPGGGEAQLHLRVEPERARREAEIESLRERLTAPGGRPWRRRLELAEICYHSGRWDEARQEYRAVLTENPRCFPAVLRLGEMLEQEGRPGEAARLYRAALRREPGPVVAVALRARLQADTGRLEQAARSFRRAIGLAPREKANYRGLHEVLGRLSRYEEQLENLERLRQLDADDLFGLVEAFEPCAYLHRWDIARPLMQCAVAIDPNSPRALKQLVQVRMNLNLHDEETVRLAERFVHLAPDYAASWNLLAWVYAETGREEEALAILEPFVEQQSG